MSNLQQHPEELITEIAMSHASMAWIVLEGESDERLFLSRNFVDIARVIAAGGWENVVTIVTGCDQISGKIVIGLIDRDYRDLKEEQPRHDNIAITEFRDIENSLFESSALKKVFCEYGSIQKMPKNDNKSVDIASIKTRLNDVAFQLGKFRAYCYYHGLSVSFQGLDHSKFVCDRHLTLAPEKLILHLSGKQSNRAHLDALNWEDTQADWLPAAMNKPTAIRHGHDLMAIVAISLRRVWGTNKGSISKEDIEHYFRLAIDNDEIQAWPFWIFINEKLNPPPQAN